MGRALDDLEPRDLPGTEEARLPFFSPDGDSVAFVTAAGSAARRSVPLGAVEPADLGARGARDDWMGL